MTTAAADGSCLGNPGPGGWGWVTDDGRQSSAGARNTTNNRMELRAVLELLLAIEPWEPLIIQCDSAYVINIFTEWLPGWKRNGMRTNGKKPVENASLILAIDGAMSNREVHFEKVAGHSGHLLNEKADALAQQASRRAQEWVRSHSAV